MWLKKVAGVIRKNPSFEARLTSRPASLERTRNITNAQRGFMGIHIWTRAFAAASSGGDTGKAGGTAGSKRPSPITEEYKAAWKKVAPTIDIHKTPSNFMKDRPAPTSTTGLPSKLIVNFVLPSKVEMSAKEVDMVIVPATTGMMGLLPGHVPTIAQLSPGLLSVHDGTDVKKFFVSSGFAIMHANSVADLLVLEAHALEKLDVEEARKGLADYTQRQSSATTDIDRANTQIAIEVYGAIVATMASTSS